MVGAASILCLQMVLFKEGENQNHRAQTAIGDTVLTRTVERHSDVCEVVLDKGQFSWTVHLKHPTIPALKAYHDKVKRHLKNDSIRMDAFNKTHDKAVHMLSSEYKRTYTFNYFNTCSRHPKGTRIDDLCFTHKRDTFWKMNQKLSKSVYTTTRIQSKFNPTTSLKKVSSSFSTMKKMLHVLLSQRN